MKTTEERKNVIARAVETTQAFETKYEEYLHTLEEQEALVEQYNDERGEALMNLHEAFGFESRKELIKALRILEKQKSEEVETPVEETANLVTEE